MASLGYLSEKKNGDSLNFALPGNLFDYAMFMSFLELLPLHGFGPEAKTRGGILGFPACIHIRNFKM